jgi:hypothetical protein
MISSASLLHAVGLGPHGHVRSTSGSGGAFRSRRPCLPAPPGCKLPSLAVLSPPRRCRGRCKTAVGKLNVYNRTDIQAFFGEAIALRGTLWRFAGTEKEKTMKCLTILCLSLGLADCCCTGPYTSANGDGPVVDLSACADSADLRVDPLCHPLTRTQLK